VVQDLWRKQSLAYQEMITQSLVMYQRPPSFVMVKLMGVTMPTQRPSVKHSISVQMTEMEDLQNTASSVLMEPCSNSSILFVIGGSMLTVLLQNSFIH